MLHCAEAEGVPQTFGPHERISPEIGSTGPRINPGYLNRIIVGPR